MEDSEKSNKEMSPRREKVSIENSFKVVQLALDFSKNGKEIIKLAEEDKKGNLSKIVKMVKKLVPAAIMTKLMKPNNDRRRQNSLQEFVYITEKLKQRVSNAKEQDARMAEDIRQCIQEGHMILAAVILHEAHTIISMDKSDNSSISKPNLNRLLSDVKSYCESVNTMKFPVEWENLITDDKGSKKASVTVSTVPVTVHSPNETKRKISGSRKAATKADGNSDETENHKHVRSKEESESEKEDTEKENSEEEETHTVQIEIRGNTGGFVGSTIEFDLVVTHEDGSPVKVHSSDFAVDIHGPASSSPVTITAKSKDDSAFRIEFIPTEPGANNLSIFMHNTLLTSGIKSIISKAGETAFLVHSKDISRGQLQGISVVPIANYKNLPKSEQLKQKLEDIATALEILESLRTKTLAEIDSLSSTNNSTT